jgi:hypothetical protein
VLNRVKNDNRRGTGGPRFDRFKPGAAPFRPNSAARNVAARTRRPFPRLAYCRPSDRDRSRGLSSTPTPIRCKISFQKWTAFGYGYGSSAPSYSYGSGYFAPAHSYGYRNGTATRTVSTRVTSTRVADVSRTRFTSHTHGIAVKQGGAHVAVTRPAKIGAHMHVQVGAQARPSSAPAKVRTQAP